MGDLSKADEERLSAVESTLAEARGAIKFAKWLSVTMIALFGGILAGGVIALLNLFSTVGALQEAKLHHPWAADIAEIKASIVGIKERISVEIHKTSYTKTDDYHSHDGKVQKLQKDVLILDSQEGETAVRFTFTVSPKVELVANGKVVPFNTLKVGDRVRVWHRNGGPIEGIELDPPAPPLLRTVPVPGVPIPFGPSENPVKQLPVEKNAKK